ncbi:GyrI-like domain-containing protein [Nesterenkonia sp. AY15]|uniref:GyrI-like domain-containing protein n=1 Tax=Nesterenkonia sp. AY15 TaxID=2901139 RepID=UPI001F4CBAFF|nr:GyrI-like domain-containing protein [Nesterenkonia sp. AY15]MCH8571527.1 GyrI-like domain-containing protein [Nesterenkonia sp. AY15]
MTEKIDFKKTLPSYRARPGMHQVLELPEMQYLMIDGHGDPNTSPEYAGSLEALYPLAFALKFSSKRELERDYVVPPLEGLWWAEDMSVFTSARDKSKWQWTLMLLVPEWIDQEMFAHAVTAVRARSSPARLDAVRLEALTEGHCVQTLHVGPFDEEPRTIEPMHSEFMPSHGLEPTGKHHEVYLSDPRRVAPEKLRTIIRQPVRRSPASAAAIVVEPR